jgi:hypothetical protein
LVVHAGLVADSLFFLEIEPPFRVLLRFAHGPKRSFCSFSGLCEQFVLCWGEAFSLHNKILYKLQEICLPKIENLTSNGCARSFFEGCSATPQILI